MEKSGTTPTGNPADEERRDEELWSVTCQLDSAFTRPEIEAARAALEDWHRRWPGSDDCDAAHTFGYAVEGLKEREQEARDLGLTPEEAAEREALLLQLQRSDFLARTAEPGFFEAAYAQQEKFRAWQKRFPADPMPQAIFRLLDVRLEEARIFAEVFAEIAAEEAAEQAGVSDRETATS